MTSSSILVMPSFTFTTRFRFKYKIELHRINSPSCSICVCVSVCVCCSVQYVARRKAGHHGTAVQVCRAVATKMASILKKVGIPTGTVLYCALVIFR